MTVSAITNSFSLDIGPNSLSTSFLIAVVVWAIRASTVDRSNSLGVVLIPARIVRSFSNILISIPINSSLDAASIVPKTYSSSASAIMSLT